MAYTQGHLDALREHAATGVLRVTYQGHTTEYASLGEIRKLIASIEAQLRPVANYSSGYNPIYSKGT